MLSIKPGVKLTGMSPQILLAITIALQIWAEYEYHLTITSMTEGKHSPGSLHYVGHAVDLRIRELDSTTIAEVSQLLRDCLGREFDVVVERTHIHVEWQPKEQLG